MNSEHMIAEFMGLSYEEKSITAPHGSGNEIKYTVYYNGGREVHLKYKHSWDELMPVVNEIYSIYDQFELTPDEAEMETGLVNDLHNTFLEVNIEETYESVIKCIEFYNKIE